VEKSNVEKPEESFWVKNLSFRVEKRCPKETRETRGEFLGQKLKFSGGKEVPKNFNRT
jgi:hypothetical protein